MSPRRKRSCGGPWRRWGRPGSSRWAQTACWSNRAASSSRRARVRPGRYFRLHDARHGPATLFTAAGVAPRVVMEILGHSQTSITMDVYTHVVQDTQREAMSHRDRLLRSRRRQ
ncbi:tyrosine-type recombinase/integrase [Streptomyces sp. NBC_00236]